MAARRVARGGNSVLRRLHGPARREHRHADLPAARRGVRHVARRRAVGIAGLPAHPDRAADPGRTSGRRPRSQAALPLRVRGLHRGLGGLRARADAGRPDRFPDRAGRRCRHAPGQQRRPGRHERPAGQVAHRARGPGRRAGDRPRPRSDPRRAARDHVGLALGVRHQRPGRGRRGGLRRLPAPTHQDASTPPGAGTARGCSCSAGATTAGLLGLSAASGLGLPAWAPAALGVTAVVCAAGFVLRERRASRAAAGSGDPSRPRRRAPGWSARCPATWCCSGRWSSFPSC